MYKAGTQTLLVYFSMASLALGMPGRTGLNSLHGLKYSNIDSTQLLITYEEITAPQNPRHKPNTNECKQFRVLLLTAIFNMAHVQANRAMRNDYSGVYKSTTTLVCFVGSTTHLQCCTNAKD